MSPGPAADAKSASAGAMEPEVRSVAAEEVTAILRSEAQPLFGVLDAAQDDAVLRLLQGGGAEMRSLYNGRRGGNLATIAPYLVALPAGSDLLAALIAEGWGRNWGIYLSCDEPFDEVRRHLRRFLVVEAEDGASFYFRFYDPRVLRPYLAACTPDELDQLFGPIRSLWMEGRAVAPADQPGGARPAVELLHYARPRAQVTTAEPGLPLIRDAQLEVLASERTEAFVDRMVQRLIYDREHDLGGRPPPDDLRGTVLAAMQRAAGYGLHREREQERFIALMGRLGSRFDLELPWAERTLNRVNLTPKDKLEALEKRATGE